MSCFIDAILIAAQYCALTMNKQKKMFEEKHVGKSRCISFGPQPSNPVMLFPILKILRGNATNKWIGCEDAKKIG